jgi:hypothetical protein
MMAFYLWNLLKVEQVILEVIKLESFLPLGLPLCFYFIYPF